MRWLGAAALAIAGALAAWLLGAPLPAALPAALLGLVAGLPRRRDRDEFALVIRDDRPAPAPSHDVLDAIDDPLLLVEGGRVTHANPAAAHVLGEHIAGEDIRLAIRHPAAAERILGGDDRADAIVLAGLGDPDRRWELTVRPLGGAARLVVELADDAPQIAGDRVQLTQLLHNLIGNALKYGRSGSPVTVGVAPAGTMLRLTVADEGDGIPDEHIPRLTERFYRVDAGRSRQLGGTGLGLAIVKHIVERHRGRLDIRSIPGRGTTVTVLLPAAAA